MNCNVGILFHSKVPRTFEGLLVSSSIIGKHEYLLGYLGYDLLRMGDSVEPKWDGAHARQTFLETHR